MSKLIRKIILAGLIFCWTPGLFATSNSRYFDLSLTPVKTLYSAGDKILIQIQQKITPQDPEFQIVFEGYYPDWSHPVSFESGYLSSVIPENDQPFVFVRAVLENKTQVQALRESIKKLDSRIQQIEKDLQQDPNSWNPADLSRYRQQKSALEQKLQTSRKVVEQKQIQIQKRILPLVEFATSGQTISEKRGTNRQLEIRLNTVSTETVRVTYLVSGSANSSDSNLVSGVATFLPGMTSVIIPFSVNQDNQLEGEEQLNVTLSNPINAKLGSQVSHVITIVDNLPPTIGVLAASSIVNTNDMTVVEPTIFFESDPDGVITEIEFDFGDGKVVRQPWSDFIFYRSVRHLYSNGQYTIRARLKDDDNLWGPYTNLAFNVTPNRLPIPKVTTQIVEGQPRTVRFDGSASLDPDGDSIQNNIWNFGDGTGTQFLGTVATKTFPPNTGNTDRAYQVFYQVRDSKNGLSLPVQFQVRVTPQNQVIVDPIPAVVVKADRLVGVAPLTVNFDASESFFPNQDFQIQEVHWSFDDQASYSPQRKGTLVRHTFERPGSYVVSALVIGSNGNRRTLFFNVYVTDANKTPGFVDPILTGGGGSDYFFDATKMSQGGLVGPLIVWRFSDTSQVLVGKYVQRRINWGPGETERASTVTARAVDLYGNVITAQRQVKFKRQDLFPNVQFLYFGQYIHEIGTPSQMRVSGIQNPQNLALSFKWDFGQDLNFTNGNYQVGDVVEKTYPSIGARFVTLRVNDSDGASNFWTIANSTYSGRPPRPSVVVDRWVAPAPATINFDASSTQPGTANIQEFYWNFADYAFFPAQSGNGAVISYTFRNPGDYYTNLFVRDSAGNVIPQTAKITILNPNSIPENNPEPVANFNFVVQGSNVLLDATSSTDDTFIRAWVWDFGDGLKSGNDGAYFNHIYSAPGTYTIRLTVYDEFGKTNSISKDVTVAPTSRPPEKKQFESYVSAVCPKETYYRHQTQPDGCNWDGTSWNCYSNSQLNEAESP